MTLINWKSKEKYIQEEVETDKALDMRETFFNIKLENKLKQLEKNNEELAEELDRMKAREVEIERLARLTILLSESTRKYQMAKDKKPPIEHDEVVNNLESIGKEYDITYNAEDGKLYLAYNGKQEDGKTNSEVILQFISLAKHPGKDKLTGLNIDRTRTSKADGGRAGLLSGIFYISNLPVDLMESLPAVEEEKIDISKEMKDTTLKPELMSFEKEMNLEGMSGKVVASFRAMAKVNNKGKLIAEDVYGLRKANPRELKAPQGLSRTEKKEYWDHLRSVYPEAFDKGGNWIGYGHKDDESTAKPSEKDTPSVHTKKSKGEGPKNTSLGLLQETGAGNLITSIVDKRVDERTCFIGRYFEKKNAYAIASTPTQMGNEKSSAMLFFEKERTANFVLEGLLKSPSWVNKLEGCQVYKASTLSQAIRSDRNRSIYFITNAVTALMALGAQAADYAAERDIVDAEYEEIKD